MFYLCYLYLFTYTCVQHDFHIRWCSCSRTVTQSMPIVKQDLPTLPKHLNSPPVFCEVCVVQSSVFCVVFCRSLFSFSLFDHCTKGEIKCIICQNIDRIWLYIWVKWRVSHKKQVLLTLCEHRSSPQCFWWSPCSSSFVLSYHAYLRSVLWCP